MQTKLTVSVVVCVRARVCVCVCACVCARARACVRLCSRKQTYCPRYPSYARGGYYVLPSRIDIFKISETLSCVSDGRVESVPDYHPGDRGSKPTSVIELEIFC